MPTNTPVSAKLTTAHNYTMSINTPDSAIYIMKSSSAVSATTPISIKPASTPISSMSATAVGSAGASTSKQSRKRPRQNHDDEKATADEQPASKKPVHHTFSDLRARITPRIPSTVVKKPTVPAFPHLFGGITPRAPPKIIKKMMPITKEEARRLQRSRDVTARCRVPKPPSRPAGTPSRQTPAHPISTHPTSKCHISTRPSSSTKKPVLKPALKRAAPKDDEDDEKIVVYNPRPRSKAALKVKALLEDSDDDLITSTKPASSKSTKAISVDSAKSRLDSAKSKIYSTTATTTGDKEDADYQYALGLHAELNGIRSRRKRR